MTIRIFKEITASLNYRPLNRLQALVTMSLYILAKFSLIVTMRDIFVVSARLLDRALK
jgi:hypothetical protein